MLLLWGPSPRRAPHPCFGTLASSRVPVDHFCVLDFEWDGRNHHPDVRRHACLTAGHGRLVGATVQLVEVVPCIPHRRIYFERPRLHTGSGCVTDPPWTHGHGPPYHISAGPCHVARHANQRAPRVRLVSHRVKPQSSTPLL